MRPGTFGPLDINMLKLKTRRWDTFKKKENGTCVLFYCCLLGEKMGEIGKLCAKIGNIAQIMKIISIDDIRNV